MSPPIILTAAHCVDEFTFNETLGGITDPNGFVSYLYADINRTYDVLNISNDTYPSLYTITFSGYDIALIIVNDFDESDTDMNITYYQTLLPSVLTSNDYDDNTQCCTQDEELIVIGYGAT